MNCLMAESLLRGGESGREGEGESREISYRRLGSISACAYLSRSGGKEICAY